MVTRIMKSAKERNRHKTSLTLHKEVMCGKTMVSVTLTKEAKTIDEWIEQRGKADQKTFGLDIEWKPNRRRGEDNKTSLLQISSHSHCLLVQLLFLDSIPDSLNALLKDPKNLFAGVGITEDLLKLRKDHALECRNVHELKNTFRGARTPLSLKTMSNLLLDLNLDKSKSVILSDWSCRDLDSQRIQYGYLDAWASGEVYTKLEATPKRTYDSGDLRARATRLDFEADVKKRRKFA